MSISMPIFKRSVIYLQMYIFLDLGTSNLDWKIFFDLYISFDRLIRATLDQTRCLFYQIDDGSAHQVTHLALREIFNQTCILRQEPQLCLLQQIAKSQD
jgi:hypothetical protein